MRLTTIKKLALTASLTTLGFTSIQAQAQTTTNPNANAQTKAIYNWIANLKGRTGDRIMTGVFSGYSGITGGSAYGPAESDGIFAKTGQRPALVGCDYAHGWDTTPVGQEANVVDYSCNSGLIADFRAGSLVTISHHLGNPAFAGNTANSVGAYKTKITDTQMQAILTNGTAERTRWLAMLDKVALGLQELQTAGVTVLYRPLHEQNGDWFWWGVQNYTYNQARVDKMRALYADIYSYMTTTKGLNNLIWMYNVDQSAAFPASYAPNNYDIASLDAYVNSASAIQGYSALTGLGKPFAIAEIGPSTSAPNFDYGAFMSGVVSSFPLTTLIMSWNSQWSPNTNLNATGMYNHAWALNRGEVFVTNPTATTPGVLTPVVIPPLFNFENNTQGWASIDPTTSVTGVYSVTDWANAGTYSLKANVNYVNNKKYTIRTTAVQNLSGKTTLTATLKIANWASASPGVVGKLYIKTGSTYTWVDSGVTTIAIGGQATVTINLAGRPNLNDVREMGVEFSTTTASGSGAVYVDNVVAQ